MNGKWLGNGWGVSNLCAPLRGIPGRGLFFPQKSAPFHKKNIFVLFIIKTSLFIMKGPDPGLGPSHVGHVMVMRKGQNRAKINKLIGNSYKIH